MRNVPACAMVLAAALIALTAGCQTAPPVGPETQWGLEQNGLRAGIQPSAEEVAPGESVEFTFYLRNAAGSPTTVLRPDAGTVIWYFDGHMIGAHPGRPHQTVVLEPGDSVEYIVRHAWMKPATYAVRAELDPGQEEMAGGKIESGVATVTVTQ